MTPLDSLKDAAWGDPAAQVRLAKAALAASATPEADPVISTVEALTFARLAAAQGDLAAIGLVVTLNAQLAELLDNAGLYDTANAIRGEALAAADLATDHVPEGSLGEVLGAYLQASEKAHPDSLPRASSARRFWEGN